MATADGDDLCTRVAGRVVALVLTLFAELPVLLEVPDLE